MNASPTNPPGPRTFSIAALSAVAVGIALMTILIAIADWVPLLYLFGEFAWVASGTASAMVFLLMRPQTSSATLVMLLVLILAITFIYSALVSWYVLGERL